MSLARGEQRTLDAIESSLCRSDPELAAMFTLLTPPASRKWKPRRESSSWRARRGWAVITVLAVATALLIASAVAGAIATRHSGNSIRFGPAYGRCRAGQSMGSAVAAARGLCRDAPGS